MDFGEKVEGISITGSSGISTLVRQVTGQPATSSSGATKESTPAGRVSDDDTVTLSPESQILSQNSASKETEEGNGSSSTLPGTSSLSSEELKQLRQLKSRDIEVRTHEQAHLSAAGQYAAGSASFTYQQGPDGTRYAIGGEVSIDISKANSPEATIEKMQTIRRAALAPANPSPADRQIAAQSSATEAQARQEVLLENQEDEIRADSAPAANIDTEKNDANDYDQPSRQTGDIGSGHTTRAMIDTYNTISALA